MQLFKHGDIQTFEPKDLAKKLVSTNLAQYEFSCLSGADQDLLGEAIGAVSLNENIYIMSNGALSNIQLIEFLLNATGPAQLYFSTWSISADAIRAMQAWQDEGRLQSVHAVLDQGIRNRKPEIYQQATAAFKNLRLCKCHAKVVVIQNDEYQVTIIGSANMTRNPRRETGMIINDKNLADANIKWIMEEFAHE